MKYRVVLITEDSSPSDFIGLGADIIDEIIGSLSDDQKLIVIDEDNVWCDADEFFHMNSIVEFEADDPIDS